MLAGRLAGFALLLLAASWLVAADATAGHNAETDGRSEACEWDHFGCYEACVRSNFPRLDSPCSIDTRPHVGVNNRNYDRLRDPGGRDEFIRGWRVLDLINAPPALKAGDPYKVEIQALFPSGMWHSLNITPNVPLQGMTVSKLPATGDPRWYPQDQAPGCRIDATTTQILCKGILAPSGPRVVRFLINGTMPATSPTGQFNLRINATPGSNWWDHPSLEIRFANATTTITPVVDLAPSLDAPRGGFHETPSLFNVTVANRGLSPTAARVTIAAGPELALSPAAEGCTLAGGRIACELSAIAPGRSITRAVAAVALKGGATDIHVRAQPVYRPEPGYAYRGAQPAYRPVDRDPSNDVLVARVVTQITPPKPELRLSLGVAGDVPFVAGAPGRASVTIQNVGASPARGEVEVAAASSLVLGLEPPAGCPEREDAARAQRLFTCPIALEPRQTRAIGFGVVARSAEPVVLTARTLPSELATSASLTVPARLLAPPDLRLAIEGPDALRPGSTGYFRVRAANVGPAESVAPPFTLVLQTSGAGSMVGAAGPATPCGLDGATARCAVPVLRGGASWAIAVDAASAMRAGSAFTLEARASDEGAAPVAKTVEIPLPMADLAFLEFGASPAAPQVGDAVTVKLGVGNLGPDPATNAYVEADIPARLDIKQDAFGPCVRVDRVVRCYLGSIDPGAARYANVTVTPSLADTYAATARLGHAEGADPDRSNNEQTLSVLVSPLPSANADLGITSLRAPPASVRANESARLEILIENSGQSASSDAVLELETPSALFVTLPSGGACSVHGRTIRCPLASIGSGGSRTLEFWASSSVLGSHAIRALVLSGNDPNFENNARELALVVVAELPVAPDVAIRTGGVEPASPRVSDPFAVAFVVAAPVSTPAEGVYFEADVPDGVTDVSASVDGRPCQLTRLVRCDIGRLGPGAEARALLEMRASLPGDLRLLARVASALGEDPTPGNNVVAVLITIQPHAPPVATQWQTLRPMPAARSSPVAGVLGGAIVVAGGYESTAQSSLFVFDPTRSAWRSGPSLPAARYGGASATLEGELWVLGGWSTVPPLPHNEVYILDRAASTWRAGPSLPKLSGCSAAGASATIYLFSPCDGYSGYRRDFWILSEDRRSWRAGPSPPAAHIDAVAVATADAFYLIGGQDDAGKPTTTVSRYAPSTGTWSSVAPLPRPRDLASAAILDGKIYVVGGRTDGPPTGAVDVYDPASDSWSSLPSLATPRYEPVLVASGRVLYAIGGGDRSGPRASVEAYGLEGAPSPKHDLALSMSAMSSFITRGRFMTITYVVQNVGAAASASSTFTLALPGELAAWTYDDVAGCTRAGDAVRCAIPALGPEARRTITLGFTPTTESRTPYRLDARVASEGDADVSNDAVSTDIRVNPAGAPAPRAASPNWSIGPSRHVAGPPLRQGAPE